MDHSKSIPYNVHIIGARGGGYLVEVGCSDTKRVYTDYSKLLDDLREYLEDPKECIKRYEGESGISQEVPTNRPVEPYIEDRRR